jgi:hypothetical protein
MTACLARRRIHRIAGECALAANSRVMETALARGQPYLPKSTAAGLLAIWQNVGAFMPLRNGRALVCARFANLCGGSKERERPGAE